MSLLVLGLFLFLGVHSVRIVSDGWRARTLARVGEHAWKGVYSLLSGLGLVLIVWGYGLARRAPVVLWEPPPGMRHLAGLLTLAAFVGIAAAYVPRNAIKASLHHPMVLGVKVWALAHLLANGTLADVLLFGAFLAWAVADRISVKRRPADESHEVPAAPPRTANDAIALIGGPIVYVVFILWAHRWIIGVSPLG